jgi:NhaP-type Na+/H+ or K+/H+ antiporter
MVLVLDLPETVPERHLLIDVTSGVVVLSILLQGSTMSPLLRRLGLVEAPRRRSPPDAVEGRGPGIARPATARWRRTGAGGG